MPNKRIPLFLALCVSLVMLFAFTPVQLHAQAPALTFATIDVSGAGETDANDINTGGTVVGFSLDPTLTIGTGFSLSNGTFTTIKVPGATDTRAYGINDAGDIVGWYIDTVGVTHGFKKTASTGKFSKIDPPFTTLTNAWSINSAGTIVGTYIGSDGTYHGFTLSGTTYTTFTAPNGALITQLTGVNNSGSIMVGIYFDSAGEQHGFELKNGTSFLSFDAPTSNTTDADRINDSGAIVGLFCPIATCIQNFGPFIGYLKNPKYHKVLAPGSTETRLRGINNAGVMVGRYTDSAGVVHGVMVTP